MKISRLYIKYFAVVMAIVILSQFLIWGLFRIVSSRFAHDNMNEYISGVSVIVSETVADKLRFYTPAPDGTYPDLSAFITRLSKSYHSRIWVTDTEGKIIASSGREMRPPFPPGMQKARGFNILMPQARDDRIFISIPVETVRGSFIIYIIHHRPRPFMEDWNFIRGLIIISAIIALILFPLSKKITIPLRKLTESAEAISRGEFDRRVDEHSSDEIGELAKAFNIMSEKILLMIQGTKELTANISHQIRSPLARITVASEMLRERIARGETEKARQSLSSIEQEIAEIDRLTGRIIELIRTDISYTSDEITRFNPGDAAKSVSLLYGDSMKRKNISFTAAEMSTLQITGIRREMEELFDILFDNAVKYAPENSNILFASAAKDGIIQLSLYNSCSMTGDIGRIFEPFYRQASEKIPGHGLGLSIAQRIVRNHHGTIRSELKDDGIIFIIELPASAETAARDTGSSFGKKS